MLGRSFGQVDDGMNKVAAPKRGNMPLSRISRRGAGLASAHELKAVGPAVHGAGPGKAQKAGLGDGSPATGRRRPADRVPLSWRHLLAPRGCTASPS